MKPLAQCRLYTFVDVSCLHGRSVADVARNLCAGGADLIQLRAKGCSPKQIYEWAVQMRPILAQADVGLVLNDHWEIARQTGADFCHLGQEDFFGAGFAHVSELPPSQGPGAAEPFLGLSTHSPAQAARALSAGPAYIAVGPVFPTPTKPHAVPVTLTCVRWAAAHISIPWFAIGGITLDTLDSVLQAGAQRICVLSAILSAPDMAARCQEFKARISAAAKARNRGKIKITHYD